MRFLLSILTLSLVPLFGQTAQHWAFEKPTASEPPAVTASAWPRGVIDQHILAALETKALAPSPDAAPHALLRRLHFRLVGLPPSPEAIERFVAATARHGLEPALEQEVDHLLASPRYGERWARHWMDVVRFAESSGKESNLTFPHAWRWRDYAIDAFNEDLPYDRFLTEQLAGDLLPADSDPLRARLLTATSVLAFGTKGLNEMNPAQFDADLVDEQIDTVTRALIGQSIACARCHDHKSDPWTMQDYYAMAGIFRSTETFFGTWIDSENNVGGDLITLPRLPEQLIPNPPIAAPKLAKLKQQLADLQAEKAAGVKTLRDALRILWRSGAIEGQLETVDETGQALPLTMGVLDRDAPVDARLFERGEVGKPGELVPRAFPQALRLNDAPAMPEDASGRLELAKWLTHPDHPLTARVMANRVWKHLMGEGIVRSVDNFGASGQAPDHPALLDYLAIRLQDEDWSIKALIREIVLSHTFRQASDWREPAFLADPENRLLWRIDKQRLEAECIRDGMLAASGQLDTSRRPGSLVATLKSQSVGLVGFNKKLPRDLDGSRRRSIYLPVIRDRLPDALGLFDAAEPSLVTGRRDKTNVPVQALYLLNSPFVMAQAEALAARLEREAPGQHEQQLRLAYLLCLSRPPLAAEATLGLDFLEKQPLAAFCQALLASAECRSVD